MQRLLWFIILVLSLFPRPTLAAQTNGSISYVALGDSYSVGEGSSIQESWPVILTLHLRQIDVPIELKKILARTGWSTAELNLYAIPLLKEMRPDFVTLMVGVNDWVRGVTADQFQERFSQLLDATLSCLTDPRRLLIINIPDFSVTPKAQDYAQGRDIEEGLKIFNRIIEAEAKSRGLKVVDIFSVSKEMATDASLLSSDNLHPSAKAYARWEQWIFGEVWNLLGDN